MTLNELYEMNEVLNDYDREHDMQDWCRLPMSEVYRRAMRNILYRGCEPEKQSGILSDLRQRAEQEDRDFYKSHKSGTAKAEETLEENFHG